MALSVTPTSGEGPYTLSIEFAHQSLIDGVKYALVVRTEQSNGVCPVPAGEPSASLPALLLSQGYYVREADVSVGACRVYKVDIVDVANSEIISTQSASIDNT